MREASERRTVTDTESCAFFIDSPANEGTTAALICIMKNTTCLQPEKIRAAIDAVFDPASHSIAEFLINGGSNNLPPATPTATPPGISSYSLDWDIIRDMFDSKHYVNGEINHTLVMQRLALIDLFYSTNTNQYSQFSLYELAEAIIKLSENANGCFDSELATKAQNFVQSPSNNHVIYTDLFDPKYGYWFTKNGLQKRSSVSIISKYLYFLLEAQGCQVGFPIYDSIVQDLLPHVARKIGISITSNGINDIVPYVIAIKNVANTLNVTHRIHNGKAMSQFAVLDFVLWRIGKVGNLSFSLLLKHNELIIHANDLAQIKKIVNSKKNTVIKQQLAYPHIINLPYRFQLWWQIYHFIK